MLLKTGSSGTQVKSLQYGLHILCCSPKSFDGSFGSATEAAVKKYQEAYGLNVDGQAEIIHGIVFVEKSPPSNVP